MFFNARKLSPNNPFMEVFLVNISTTFTTYMHISFIHKEKSKSNAWFFLNWQQNVKLGLIYAQSSRLQIGTDVMMRNKDRRTIRERRAFVCANIYDVGVFTMSFWNKTKKKMIVTTWMKKQGVPFFSLAFFFPLVWCICLHTLFYSKPACWHPHCLPNIRPSLFSYSSPSEMQEASRKEEWWFCWWNSSRLWSSFIRLNFLL